MTSQSAIDFGTRKVKILGRRDWALISVWMVSEIDEI